jgi:choline dehydrogenase-like flavoprotein
MSDHSYDAIVVGSGISGGWAAKELCEKGLKTLVLERGRSVKHGDYPTAFKDAWDLPNGGVLSEEEAVDYIKQSRSVGVDGFNKHFFLKDTDHDYEEVKPFHWIQGNQVGGKSITWGRKCYRWSDIDFEANLKDGYGVDWPIRYKDLAPWYEYVERFVGVSGEKLGLPQIPDGIFQKPWDLTVVEKHLRKSMMEKFGRHLTVARSANLSTPIHGRGACQFRNRCKRGCPYGAYFSSLSSTLPAAEATGNLTLRSDYLVDSVIFDNTTQKATGVRVVNTVTNKTTEYFAKVIFLNASALNSTAIMLNSRSERFPNGIGNDSDQLGRNLMDHHFRVGASAEIDGFKDRYFRGRRPGGLYIPRYRNIDEKSKHPDFLRGYNYQGNSKRMNWMRGAGVPGFGAAFKDDLMNPGEWTIKIGGFGEVLPYADNRMTLDFTRRDKWGQPIKVIDASLRENELAMRKDMAASGVEMLEAAGFKSVKAFDDDAPIGSAIHEMGTARMGRDPKTSVLNGHNQVHAVRNLFVTDGACMTSSACQNPSITYMALTARAVDYAVSQMKKGNI